jgi:hypothetical protein
MWTALEPLFSEGSRPRTPRLRRLPPPNLPHLHNAWGGGNLYSVWEAGGIGKPASTPKTTTKKQKYAQKLTDPARPEGDLHQSPHRAMFGKLDGMALELVYRTET